MTSSTTRPPSRTHRCAIPTTRSPNTPVNAATNLVVADQLPSGLDFVDFTNDGGGRCTYDAAARTITCNVGTLQPDADVHVLLQRDRVGRRTGRHTRVAGQRRLLRRQFRGPAGRRVPRLRSGDRRGAAGASSAGARPTSASSRPSRTTSSRPGTRSPGRSWAPTTDLPPRPASCSPISCRRACQFVSASASPELTCTTPPVGSSGVRDLHGAKRARGTGRGVVADADDRRDGAVDNRGRHAPAQRRHGLRRPGRADSRPAPQPRRDADAGARSRPADPAADADARAPGRRTARHSRPSRRCTRPTFPAARPTRC